MLLVTADIVGSNSTTRSWCAWSRWPQPTEPSQDHPGVGQVLPAVVWRFLSAAVAWRYSLLRSLLHPGVHVRRPPWWQCTYISHLFLFVLTMYSKKHVDVEIDTET